MIYAYFFVDEYCPRGAKTESGWVDLSDTERQKILELAYEMEYHNLITGFTLNEGYPPGGTKVSTVFVLASDLCGDAITALQGGQATHMDEGEWRELAVAFDGWTDALLDAVDADFEPQEK